jgi:hypothetical protein
MSDDKKLAENVRAAARALCGHLNAAAEAGLLCTVEIKPYQFQNSENGDKRWDNYRPSVSIWRTEHK